MNPTVLAPTYTEKIAMEHGKQGKLRLKKEHLKTKALKQEVKIAALQVFTNDAVIHKLRAQKKYLYTAAECAQRLEIATQERLAHK